VPRGSIRWLVVKEAQTPNTTRRVSGICEGGGGGGGGGVRVRVKGCG